MTDFRSGCPISTTLDLVGDRWTLVIVRDLINGKKRYSEFLESPEQITTNVLADRLNKLESAGLAVKSLYQTRPKRYEYDLTQKGEALLPIVQEMCKWANTYMPDTWTPQEAFMARRPLTG